MSQNNEETKLITLNDDSEGQSLQDKTASDILKGINTSNIDSSNLRDSFYHLASH